MRDLCFQEIDTKDKVYRKEEIDTGHIKRIEGNGSSWQKISFDQRDKEGFMA